MRKNESKNLSILFMRFVLASVHSYVAALSYCLSILFMRFGLILVSPARATRSRLSILFMRFDVGIPQKILSPVAYIFQFSL